MFLGHFAVAFAGKKVAPKTSLGTLFLAAQFLDVLWPFFVLIGAEHFRIIPGITRFSPFDFYDYPLSHSLPMALTWAAGFGLVYFIATNKAKVAWILSALVLSHWFLDVIVHRPDLLVLPRGPFWGLGLWNSIPGTLIVEGGLFAAGLWVYLQCTKPKDKTGEWGLYGLVLFLIAVYLSPFAAPLPSNPVVVAFAAQIIWVIIAWALWVDDHRKAV